MKTILNGLLQKALLDAQGLHQSYRINPNGDLWRYSPLGWIKTGEIHNERDREDFLVGKLTQEDR
jgi:fermentation-respiration switch protein FrsA (DUF1100 family)